ncbi:hypothetical protein pf16_136 [Pseudomonas phage pf16]|uniref:DNA ligase n=1 Tax=Pseudomonas phage pf16 TaxID=1815630 RepID=A0A1S5R3S9_9CAUD|nr:hypothetical protein FDG98_gp162 [Pseudomonas phage pf16]AND75059.1 hypothetical protein pf16_136 [Pseudomonas phage pf16]
MLNIINQIAATSSRLEKDAIIRSLVGEQAELFKKLAVATYSGAINYYATKYPRPEAHWGNVDLATALDSLKALTSRQVTGNKALTFLTALESSLSEEDGELLYRVIQRDLRAGFTEGTVNKVWPGLIYEHPYMRCSSFNPKNLAKIKFPAYSQSKSDGKYTDIVVEDHQLQHMSRQGTVMPFSLAARDKLFMKYPGYVFMGESLARNEDGTIMPRAEGNGYLDSSDVNPARIVFVLWDMVPLADWKAGLCKVDYKTRLNTLKRAITEINSPDILLSNTKVVNSGAEILEHFKEEVEKGEEGTVIKNQHALWKDGTSPDQIKCKIEFECELKVFQVNEGTGANVGKLGAFGMQSEEGMVKVFVGTGYKQKEREALFSDAEIGGVWTVKANDITKDRNSDTYSLFLPRAMKKRSDKTVADTYERIKEQMDAFIYTLEAIGK